MPQQLSEDNNQKNLKVFGPYSPIRKAGELYFIAGQVGIDSLGNASDNFTEQFEITIQNLNKVLASEKLELKNIINIRVYLIDIDNFGELNRLFAKYFTGIGPSRECVAVKSLPKISKNRVDIQVEISAIACAKI